MLNSIQAFYIDVVAPIDFQLDFTTDPFPLGTNVVANISLSFIDTLFEGKIPDPTFVALAFVEGWTVYLPDGTESGWQGGLDFNRNAVGVQNVARINFRLFAERVWAIAQINIFLE